MPWTETASREYQWEMRRYASDMTDHEWALIAPFMPPLKRLGRPRTMSLREVVNAILYIATTGCQWAMRPKEFPPYSAVQLYFYDWRDSGAAPHDPVRPGHGHPRAGRMRCPADSRRHQQPDGGNHRKRRCPGLRCRQEDQRTQASCGRRHHRPPVRAGRACRRCTGPRRRADRARFDPQTLSLAPALLR